MTNKFLPNLLGFNPDLTSRQPRVDSLSLVSHQSDLLTHLGRIAAILLLVLTIGVGNAWAGVRSGWTRVTTVKEITDGGTFIVGFESTANSNTIVPMINKPTTLTGTTGSNATSYLYSGTTSSSDNTTIDMSDKGSGATTNFEFEFVAGSSSGKIAIKLSDATYVGFYGSSNNNCRRYASVGTNASFTPTITTNDVVTLTNVEYTGRKLKFNNSSGSYRFSNYSTAGNVVLYKKASSCDKSVGVTKGSESHGEVTTIGSASVATCSSTASDRQVTITVTPDDCYDAPSTLTWTKSSGTVSASKQSGPTDNGDGTYSYVYQFAQNDNGAGTFGVTCTAKAASKTVNFDAGPGSCLTSSLTETCDGSGVTLPAVTATGVCKGWTTFAGWATSAVSDSTTTSGVTLYAAGSTYVPASNNMTLYAVYSKVKGGGTTTLLSENFADCSSGNNTSTSGSGTSWSRNDNFYSGSNTYQAGGAVKLGGSSSVGYLITKQLTAAIGDQITISFKVKGWTTVEGNIQVEGNNSEFTKPSATTYTATMSGSFESKSVTVTLTKANPKIKIGTTAKRAFLDDLLITKGSSATYYCSDPNCCTNLGSINGSFNLTQSNGVLTATLPSASKNANATSYRFTLYNNSDVEITHTDVATGGGDVSTTFSSPNVTAGNTYKVSVTPLVSPQGSFCSTTGTESDKASITMHYTVTLAVNNAEYGSISPTSTLYVASGTSISASTNTLSVGATNITATYTPQTAQYTYGFTNWTWSPSGATITANTTATANFSRSTRTYNVTTTGITHATASPAIPATVAYGGSITTTITADANYTLPSAITVTGATLDSWNSSTGALSIIDVTGDVSITITAVTAMKRIYMNTGGTSDGKWGKDNPKFFVHSWGSSDYDAELVAQPCASNVFYADIPEANTYLLFTRQDPSAGSSIIYKDNDGNWGQSVDITISTNNYFTFNGNWDVSSTGKSGFDAGTYTPDMKTIYLSFCAEWLENNPLFGLYDVTHSTWMSTFAEAGTGCYAGYYIAQVPSCATTVLIGRFKPGTPAPFGWSGENWWGQSVDFNIGADTYDKITIAGWGTEGDANGKGYGSLGNFALTQYSISFAGGGGTGSMSSLTNKDCGSDVTLPNVSFTKTGYDFDGWHADVDVKVGGATIPAGSTIANQATLQDIRSNVALTAQWVAKEYSVSLDNESPTVSGSTSVTLTYNSATHDAITNPTKTGYTFAGWWTGDNGTGTEVINASGVLQANVTNYTGAGGIWTRDNNSTTLYAKWTPINYTITYNLNGGTQQVSPAPATGYTIESSAITLPTPTKEHYDFAGWYANSDLSTGGVQTTIAAGSTGNKTYWAKWTIKSATITLNNYTGSATTTGFEYGDSFTLPSTNTYSCNGKTFAGWSTVEVAESATKPASNFYEPGTSVTLDESNTFYAVFADAGGDDYELVTSSSTALAAGDMIIIASSGEAGDAKAIGAQTVNGSSVQTNRKAIAVTIASGDNGPIIENPTLATSTSNTTNIYPFILEANDGAFAIKEDVTSGRYLAATGADANNYLATVAEVNTTTAKFSISIAAETSVATVVTTGATRGTMQFNSTLFACYKTSQSPVYIYRKPAGSNYTTNCVACTEVTLSISAAANGTMTVKRGGAAQANGATVPTCAAQTLKVKVTPNTHYRLTAMTISGASASVSPSTSSGLPSASEIEYTVTIPADATGTLTISPTIAATPTKTVVFKTNGEASGESNQIVYVGEAPTMPAALASGKACDAGYNTFYGWTQATWSGTKVPSEMAELTGSDIVLLPGATGFTLTDSDPSTITYNAVWADGTATTTYTKLTSVASISDKAQYVLGIDGTGFHYTGTSSWGTIALPSSQTPLYYTLSIVSAKDNTFTASTSISSTTYYLAPPESNEFSMSTSSTTLYLGQGSNKYSDEYGICNSTTHDRHLRVGASGLRSYAGPTGNQAYFYKVGLADDANFLTHCCTKYTITGASTSGTSVTGGTLTSTFNSVCADNDVKITATVSEGYRFDGWSITAGGSPVARKGGSADTEGGNPIYVFTMPSANVTVSATITRVYSVTYAANSGTGTMTDANKYAAGATVTVQSNTFTRSGYNWSSWSYSPDVTVTNNQFTMPSSDVTITANWTAKPLVSISLSAASGTVYVDQYADFTVTYDPADYISPGYTLNATPVYVTKVAQAPANTLLRLKGGRGSGPGASITETVNETVTIKASGDNTKTASVNMTVNPLPRVHFEDLVHGKEFADVVATIAENALNRNKTTKTSVDWVTPNANTCEENHLHLVGWIRSDWPALVAYLNGTGDAPTTTAIVGAGNDASGHAYYFAAGASIDVQIFDGVTFYAVWAEIK